MSFFVNLKINLKSFKTYIDYFFDTFLNQYVIEFELITIDEKLQIIFNFRFSTRLKIWNIISISSNDYEILSNDTFKKQNLCNNEKQNCFVCHQRTKTINEKFTINALSSKNRLKQNWLFTTHCKLFLIDQRFWFISIRTKFCL